MIARGMTATSGRQGRSCDGWMSDPSHGDDDEGRGEGPSHVRTRVNQRAQTPKARNATASAMRSHVPGKLE